jgi:maltooligosyltrehalose trehalohydrolase
MTSPDRRRRSRRCSSTFAWQPSLGAWCDGEGAHFRVWAPDKQHVEVVVESRGSRAYALGKQPDGTFMGHIAEVGPGDLYRYRLDGAGPFPDPASRFQPNGVHGASQIVDASRFAWPERDWPGVSLEQLVVYELHVGTFSPDGTFGGAAERLPYLRDLGVTAVELMPVADFPGARNWGYDGVALFAPARCYGSPDDLRRLVDGAHELGLAVLLDVAYNHLGPDGAYLGAFSPHYLSKRRKTPWGAAINLDGPQSEHVRELFIENALHWIHEYRIDGLRLDATHALIDESPRHFLAQLSARVRETTRHSRSHPILLIAEDHRNLVHMVQPEAQGGWGLDAVWADDFHHQVRRALAGDDEGYYSDFTGSMTDVAATLRRGWFFTGQHSDHLGKRRGTDPAGTSPACFVICLQNHDQVGNRAFGERLHHQIDLAAYRAATVLLLLAPQTPLLFMGQEWAASTPFLFFTDHKPDLGKVVARGRRREFGRFSAFSDPAMRKRIPDPQADTTFTTSRLDWSEGGKEPHSSVLRLHQALLRLRRSHPALQAGRFEVRGVRNSGVILIRRAAAESLVVIVHLKHTSPEEGRIEMDGLFLQSSHWRRVLDTEDEAFTSDPQPPVVEQLDSRRVFRFARPGAVVLGTRG